MFCSRCGAETTGNPTFCSGCGAPFTDGQVAKKTWLSTAAGTINIVDGFLKGVLVLLIIVGISFPTEGEAVKNAPSALVVAIVMAVLAIPAIFGGICAIQRRRWGAALAGAIAGTVPLFPLGIASVILLAKSRDEFEQPQPQRVNM